MKRCPQCNRIATDDLLTFCRVDGVRLVQDSRSLNDSETVALPPDKPLAEASTTDESLSAPCLTTNPLSLSKATNGTRNMIKGRKRRIGIAVIAAIIVSALGSSAYYSISRKNNAPIYSLAVLPFINVSPDEQLDYLADGMTENLISNLSQLPILNVKAHSSVLRFKGKDVSPRPVGAELNVQAILNGRLTLHGELLTLSLELADARTENVIWSQQYTRKETDVVSLQNEIARDVTYNLRVKLARADEQKLSKKYTNNTEAYELYLKGRFYWNKRTLKDLETALEYFNQAIALDPNYALAYAGLADTYVLLPQYRNEPVREALPLAQEAALKALSLDSDLAEPHATLGRVKTNQYDFTGAETEYKRAIELDPNYATAHQWYGILLFDLARNDESQAELRRALELDPLSLIINLYYAESFYYARQYDAAIAQLRKTLELNTEFATTYQWFTKSNQANGNYGEAVKSYAAYRKMIGDRQGAALIRESFTKGGWTGFLQAVTAKDQTAKLTRYEAVVFLTALGDKEKAFAELERSFDVFGPSLRIDPLLDPLRADPRFASILTRAGL
ncbi:MAG TPA: tetratricopeptide repeat protein [Blastocatellia bacterium]|nr:tetratricopeptide repeat protein [Blastocatellia bacterium]